MSTKVKNIFSAKNLTQIFLGMAIIAVAGLNVKLAMRSQDWSFLSLMNIESLGLTTAENTKDSLSIYQGPNTPVKAKCKHTTKTEITMSTAAYEESLKASKTTSDTKTSGNWNVGVQGGIPVISGNGGYNSGSKSNTNSTDGVTTTTVKKEGDKVIITYTTEQEYERVGHDCPKDSAISCFVYIPKCDQGDQSLGTSGN